MAKRCLQCDLVYPRSAKLCPACGAGEHLYLNDGRGTGFTRIQAGGWLLEIYAALTLATVVGAPGLIVATSVFLDATGGALLLLGIDKVERLVRGKLALTVAGLAFFWMKYQHGQLALLLMLQPLILIGLLAGNRDGGPLRPLVVAALACDVVLLVYALGTRLGWLSGLLTPLLSPG